MLRRFVLLAPTSLLTASGAHAGGRHSGSFHPVHARLLRRLPGRPGRARPPTTSSISPAGKPHVHLGRQSPRSSTALGEVTAWRSGSSRSATSRPTRTRAGRSPPSTVSTSPRRQRGAQLADQPLPSMSSPSASTTATGSPSPHPPSHSPPSPPILNGPGPTSGVTVLSALDPVRVYQDFAQLDLLSHGRAEIIAGRSAFVEPFADCRRAGS